MSKLENNTASLQAVSEKINGVNNEINSQATTIAEIAALLDGKSVPGGSGSSSGIEYEIVTIPAGTGEVTYSLPRITAAYGSISDYLMSFEGTGGILSLRNNSMMYIDYLEEGPRGYVMETSSSPITYSNGVINVGSFNRPNSIEVILINDPSATAISI